MNKSRQATLNFGHESKYDIKDFLVSGSNEIAFKWISDFPNWKGQKISIIYGDAGCGKTHLGKIWQNKSEALSFIDSNSKEEIIDSLSKGRNILIDDCDKLDDDKLLYNIYNICKEESSGFVLLTSVSRPIDWKIELADAKSRILSLNAIKIEKPDDFLLSGLLVKLFTDRQLKVSPEIINYLLLRMNRSFNDAICLVDKIDKLSLEKKRNITIPLVKDIL